MRRQYWQNAGAFLFRQLSDSGISFRERQGSDSLFIGSSSGESTVCPVSFKEIENNSQTREKTFIVGEKTVTLRGDKIRLRARKRSRAFSRV